MIALLLLIAVLASGPVQPARAATCGGAGNVGWDTATKSALLSLNGMTATHSGANAWGSVFVEGAIPTGKRYYEVTVNHRTPNNSMMVGFDTARNGAGWIGLNAGAFGYADAGYYYEGGAVGAVTGVTYAAGDVVGVAIDLDAHKVWVAKNGSWVGGGDPAAGASPGYAGFSGTIYPGVSMYFLGDAFTANFGGSAFMYSPPSGFTAWGQPQVCTGQYVCAVSSGTACASWVELSNDNNNVATFDELGVTGGAIGLCIALGVGLVLLFSGVGEAWDIARRAVQSVLGGR